MIPITIVDVKDSEELVLQVLRSGNLAQGPMVAQLERDFAALHQVDHAIAVNNGTTALVAAIESLHLGVQDEVVTSPFTFVATLNAVLEAGATVRFADISEDDFCVSASTLSENCNSNTRVLMPVDLYGQTANMIEISSLAKSKGLRIVEDAAQAHGASICSQMAGSFDIGTFSLYATKNITSGEGGMIPDERRYSEKWYYQCIQSRYGFNPHHAQLADAIEVFIGQGQKVGMGGHLMGQKVTDQVAEMRSLPSGIDQRSPARHPDWLGPDDLALKVEELRQLTKNKVPIQLKLGASKVYDDVRMAAKCNPDSIFLDGMEGSTGAGPHIAAANTGIPGIAAIREARRAIDDVGKTGQVTLIYAGGVRDGADMAKALALGADAIAIGTGALMALNCNKDIPEANFEKEMGVKAGECYHCHTGRCPVGVATQDPKLRARLNPDDAALRVYNYLHAMTLEAQLLARACGKTNIHSLEPEDLAALTMEASALAKVPLTGTNFTVGVDNYHKI